MIGSHEKFNADKIVSRYSEVVLSDEELIHPRAKDDSFSSMFYCHYKDIKFTKWSCVLKFSLCVCMCFVLQAG